MSTATPREPQIIEAFNGYDPSFPVTKLVRKMLRSVPPKFLGGLHAVVLTNAAALSRQQRKKRGLGTRTPIEETLGYYSEVWMGEPARITLLLDNIEKQWPGWWWRIGFIRAMAVSRTFFHELGHHIHRVHRPKYEDREDVAKKYSRKLSSQFLLGRYWYLVPIAAPIALIVGLASDVKGLVRRLRARGQRGAK